METATLITILVIIVIWQHWSIGQLKSKVNRLVNRCNALKIPFDDYSHYQKAYVEMYKWLKENSTAATPKARFIYRKCLDKLEELFNNDKN